MELWKDVVGYKDRYKVSDAGRLYSVVRGHTMRPAVTNSGYKFVNLYSGGKHTAKTALIHRLVASAFIGTTDTSRDVNHKNGDKLNNQVHNLEWCSRRENVAHAMRNGLVGEPKRMPVIGTSILDGHTVNFPSQKAAEIALSGTSKQSSAIHHCLKGTKKSAYGYIWVAK
jgi:hypothetical protein